MGPLTARLIELVNFAFKAINLNFAFLMLLLRRTRCRPSLTFGRFRFYAGHREMETNLMPAAADIIYKNSEAISNRIQLFHLIRLRIQEKLDRSSLQSSHSYISL
jgi:hypothetical protein